MTDVQTDSLDNSLCKVFPSLEGKWEQGIDTVKYHFIKQSPTVQTEILKKVINNFDNEDFFQMVEDHLDTLDGKTDEDTVHLLCALSEDWSKSKDFRIFTYAEALISGSRVSPETAQKFSMICKNFYKLTNDPHFKLFADFSKIYSAEDKDELEAYLGHLRELYMKANSYSDRYYTLYLLCLCLQRLCLCGDDKIINTKKIDLIYGNYIARNSLVIDRNIEKPSEIFCVERDHENWPYNEITLIDYGEGEHSVTIDFEKIINQNFPAICRLFVTDYHYCDAEMENRLFQLSKNIKELTKYNKREIPLLSEKLSFCRYVV